MQAPPPARARGRGSRQGKKMVHDPGKQVGDVFGRRAQPLAPGSLCFRKIVVARAQRLAARQQAAPGDAPGVAARIEKSPMQPELVFVGVEYGTHGRRRKGGEPRLSGRGELLDFRGRDWRQAASEPLPREPERHRFQAAQLRSVPRRPSAPERVVPSVGIKNGSDLVNVRWMRAAAK
jgi:hypothetical protein